jgi:hypothetical protein
MHERWRRLVHSLRPSRLWELPDPPLEPEEKPDKAGTLETIVVTLLVAGIPAAPIYLVLDLPWYVDAVILIVWIHAMIVIIDLVRRRFGSAGD